MSVPAVLGQKSLKLFEGLSRLLKDKLFVELREKRDNTVERTSEISVDKKHFTILFTTTFARMVCATARAGKGSAASFIDK